MKKQAGDYGRFYALLNRLPHEGDREELKRDIVRQYTAGRTESLREMTGREYDAMCAGLADAIGETAREQQRRDCLRRRRSVCLRLMQQSGIDTTDWSRVNGFCNDPRIAGKPFAAITAEELGKLSVKLRAIQRAGGLRRRTEGHEPAEVPVVWLHAGSGLGEC